MTDLYKTLRDWGREGAVSFDTGLREADFEYWLEFRTWTVHQAIVLSLGKDPRAVSFETASKGRSVGDHESIFLKDYKPRLEVILNWIGSSELPSSGGVLYPHLSQIDFKEFVYWAASRGWDLPRELEGLANATDLLSDEASNPKEFRNMEGLNWEEITITLLNGDHLEVLARGITRKVFLADLGLMNKTNNRPTKSFISLTALAVSSRGSVTPSNSVTRDRISKLRKSLKEHFGINTDPLPVEGRNYVLRFLLVDKRDAADQRAKERALRTTVPFDDGNLAHQGTDRKTSHVDPAEYPYESDELGEDAAAEYLKGEAID